VTIGNSIPTAKLDVNGRVDIDSALVVKDSVTMKSNLRVEEDANFMSTTNMKDAEVNQLFKPMVIQVTNLNGVIFHLAQTIMYIHCQTNHVSWIQDIDQQLWDKDMIKLGSYTIHGIVVNYEIY